MMVLSMNFQFRHRGSAPLRSRLGKGRFSLHEIAWVMFKTGTLTVGGGGATTAAIQREMVEEKKWLSQEDFSLCYALGRITPGTNLFAMCAAVGYRMAGWPGAVACLVMASLPSSMVAWGLTLFAERWQQCLAGFPLNQPAGALAGDFRDQLMRQPRLADAPIPVDNAEAGALILLQVGDQFSQGAEDAPRADS